MMKNITFIAGQLGLGGAERQLYYLLANMDRSIFNPFVINLGSRSDEYWEGQIKDLDIPVVNIPRSIGKFRRLNEIRSILKNTQSNLVHCWHFHTSPYAILAGAPTTLSFLQSEVTLYPANHPFFRFFGFTCAKGVVTNSTKAFDQIKKLKCTRAPVYVVQNGVTIPAPIGVEKKAELRSKLGLRPDNRIICTAGRMDENKNQKMLLRVFSRIEKMYPRLTLVIFGDGLLRDQLLKMVQELNIDEKVFFPGSIPNASDYFPAMDYFCMTSKSEGLSNSIMEASAAGLPIITTDSGGSDEIVDDGKTGYVINQQDEDTYFSKLKQIIDHPELSKSMGSLGREKMQKKYGIEVMVNKLSAIYLNY